MTLSKADALILSMASPLSLCHVLAKLWEGMPHISTYTPCVIKAYTFLAPSFFKSLAALVMVFDVSARSSIRIAVRFATSPTSIIVAF